MRAHVTRLVPHEHIATNRHRIFQGNHNSSAAINEHCVFGECVTLIFEKYSSTPDEMHVEIPSCERSTLMRSGKMDRPVLPVTYEKLDEWIHCLRPTLASEEFVCVVGILRGGGVIALMVSHEIGVPVGFLRYDRETRHVDWDSSIPIPAPGSAVLICEDIAGSGDTLADCVAFLQARRLAVKTLTAGFDDLSRIRPDYGIDGRGYFLLFPWERHAYTDEYREQWRKTHAGREGKIQEDHVFQIVGIDLDGILLPDVPLLHYDADLQSALRERDCLQPFANLPPIDVHRSKVIVTGRPEVDRARTEIWLRTYGFDSISLVMRDPSIYDDSSASVAAHKAHAAMRFACTHFIESDPVQAIQIAGLAPLLRVIWWNALSNEGKLISTQNWSASVSHL